MPAAWSALPSHETTTQIYRDHRPRYPASPGNSPAHTHKNDTIIPSINQSNTQIEPVLKCLTLMLFLNWYPGLLEPLRRSSLKMMICSNKKTLRSLLRDRTPPSCSKTQKVSCCSNFPWEVSFPWKTDRRVRTERQVIVRFFLVFFCLAFVRVYFKLDYLLLLWPLGAAELHNKLNLESNSIKYEVLSPF